MYEIRPCPKRTCRHILSGRLGFCVRDRSVVVAIRLERRDTSDRTRFTIRWEFKNKNKAKSKRVIVKFDFSNLNFETSTRFFVASYYRWSFRIDRQTRVQFLSRAFVGNAFVYLIILTRTATGQRIQITAYKNCKKKNYSFVETFYLPLKNLFFN